MKRQPAAAAAPSIIETLQAHVTKHSGSVSMKLTHSAELRFHVDVAREAPAFDGETEKDIGECAWTIEAEQGDLPHVLNESDTHLETGLTLRFAQHHQLYTIGQQKEWSFDRMLVAADVKALFVGLEAMRARLQAAGFDV